MSCKIIVIISEHLLQPPNNIQLFFSNTSSLTKEKQYKKIKARIS